jgi:diguanylate cyclase (GGDEF)-like protein
MADTDRSPSPDEDTSLHDQIVQYVNTVLTSPSASEADFPANLRDVPAMGQLNAIIWAIRNLAFALSKGELDVICRERGFVIGALKAFQANLRHLTWQAQRIAAGEFDHRVNFLGDFSIAFNQMTEQLGSTVTTLKQLNEEYKDLSHKDALTGLYNRHAFMKYAANLIVNERRSEREASLVMSDIDKFKSVNDTYGHLCGDEVLRCFAKRLSAGLRNRDLCARYGGEEFIILMPNTPLEIGVRIAERIRGAVEAMTIPFEGRMLRVTASFGVSRVDGVITADQFEEYIKACIHIADANLYTAKQSGRNRVVAMELAPEAEQQAQP